MIRRATKRRSQTTRRISLRLESLEGRQLLSADAGSALSATLAAASMTQVRTGLFARPVSLNSVKLSTAATSASPSLPATSVGPAVSGPYTPTQIRRAYGVDRLPQDGTGQTIALIDAYDDPTIASDLAAFDKQFNLPAANFVEATPGGATPAYDSGWAMEISLDVEWAHAIAPGAKILLVEAASDNGDDLFNAVDYAVAQGANQVSMSFGGTEFPGVSSLDSHFSVPGVSFFASSGDGGAAVDFPAVSPYVTGVGGTTAALDSSGNKISETAWSGSGGGTSVQVARPAYQTGFQSSSSRGVPDVSYDADPNSGVYVYDAGIYYGVGGTSAGAPQWAGLAALVNQGRAANGLSTIGTGLTDGLNSALYSLAGGTSYTNPNGDFLDVTSGSNGNPAKTGYDTVTGLGSPVANKLVPDLIAFGTSTPPPTSAPAVGDSGFEAASAGSGFYGFAYNPAGSPWTFAGESGVSGNGSAFTSSNAGAPQGKQVAFLQNQGTIAQSVANWAAGSYQVSFQATQRVNYGSAQSFQVLVDGTAEGTITPASQAGYQQFTSNVFTVGAGSHTITFKGLNAGGDATAFLDNVVVATPPPTSAPAVGDSGFEAASAGSGFYGFAYNPAGSPWTFAGESGVSGNGSAFTSSNAGAPQGKQVAFLQNQGTIAQSVANWAAGSYRLSLLAAQRASVASNQTFQVLVDNAVVATFNPSSTSYQNFTTAVFTVTAGTHTIAFQSVATAGGDNTAFLDNITIASA